MNKSDLLEPQYTFNCPDQPNYLNILSALMLVFQLIQGVIAIWTKHEQSKVHEKVQTNTYHLQRHSTNIDNHTETLSKVKTLISALGVEVNELNNSTKRNTDLFMQASSINQSKGFSGESSSTNSETLQGKTQYNNMINQFIQNKEAKQGKSDLIQSPSKSFGTQTNSSQSICSESEPVPTANEVRCNSGSYGADIQHQPTETPKRNDEQVNRLVEKSFQYHRDISFSNSLFRAENYQLVTFIDHKDNDSIELHQIKNLDINAHPIVSSETDSDLEMCRSKHR